MTGIKGNHYLSWTILNDQSYSLKSNLKDSCIDNYKEFYCKEMFQHYQIIYNQCLLTHDSLYHDWLVYKQKGFFKFL